MEYTKKFLYQSNQWYNDGLRRANIRDLSGAVTSLKKSLQFNRDNIAARNLLGLVYFGQGEVAEALVEWIISKNIKSHENIADYYIKKVQETPSELEVMNQAIKKYNQCLTYCQQDGEDLAVIQLKKVVASHPTFLKAYQLLALLYLKTEQYAKARQVLRRAHKLDATNEITIRYMHELTKLHNKKTAKAKEEKDQTVTYNLGNETIIQPVSASLKDNAATITIMNIVIGILMGAAIVWFLIVPAINHSKDYQAKEKELEAEKQKAANTQSSYEALIDVIDHYNQNNYSTTNLIDELLALSTDSLGEVGKAQYDEMTSEIFPKQCDKLYRSARQSYRVENYGTAIESLEKVMKMNESYEDGKALLLLADSYAGNGDTEKATEKYNRVIELFPDSDVAQKATEALNGTNDDGDNNSQQ